MFPFSCYAANGPYKRERIKKNQLSVADIGMSYKFSFIY